MSLNTRQLRLKNMLEFGNIPEVVDATFISNIDESQIPFHWHDIEQLNYGYSTRYYDWSTDQVLISRCYTGPNAIRLMPQNKILKNGDKVSD